MREAVEDLAEAYLHIRRDGCIQFDDLRVVLHCPPSEAVAIEIKLTSVGKQMYGYSCQKTTLEHCGDITTYLKDCIEKWRASMDKKRG